MTMETISPLALEFQFSCMSLGHHVPRPPGLADVLIMSLAVLEWDRPAPAPPNPCRNRLPGLEISPGLVGVFWHSLGSAYEIGTAMRTSKAVPAQHGLLQSILCRYWCACTATCVHPYGVRDQGTPFVFSPPLFMVVASQ